MRNLPSSTTVLKTLDEMFRDFNHLAIGFEPMISRIHNLSGQPNGYPPYNLDHDGDQYRLELAVAGFKLEELDISLMPDGVLTVKGSKNTDRGDRKWIHRGIAARDFERSFTLAEHIKVTGAKLEDGMLTIELVREVPEPAKGRNIPISTNTIDVDPHF